ncbi:MAG: DUF6603 domain-containing protein [Actinomycetes bacterium]
MSLDLGLPRELDALARAAGLVDGSGQLDPDWLAEPLTRLRAALHSPAQRAGLGEFLDLALPPTPRPGRSAGEKWHPLLGELEQGNLYLTLNETPAGLVLGLAGDFHTADGAAVVASLRLQADLVLAGSDLELLTGTSEHPIMAELRVETNWVFAPPAQPVGLRALLVRFSVVPDPEDPQESLQVVLEGLSLGGETPTDTVMDVAELGVQAPDLLVGLLQIVLAEASGDAAISRLADHFLALFGLADSDAIPAFPFAGLVDPGTVQHWLTEVSGLSGVAATAGPWMEHLAGLFGTDVTALGAGTADSPWRTTVVQFTGGEVFVTLAVVAGHLRLGAGVTMGGSLGAGDPELRLVADAALVDVPLAGAGSPVPLPRAAVLVTATGSGGAALVEASQVKLGSVEAGFAWDGSALAPTLVLLNSELDGVPYERLDLTNVDSVEATATNIVVTRITQALGSGAGRRLAALVGLVPPEDPAQPGTNLPGWTHQLDLGRFVVDPSGAIGAYHRGVLSDGDSWRHLLREIGELLGLGGVSAAAGTEADPWTIVIDTQGGARLQVAAWHQTAPGDATVVQLRLGLRVVAESGDAELALVGEVLTFDLPASGPASVSFLGTQQLRLRMQPALEADVGAVSLSLDALTAALGWAPGQPLRWQVRADTLHLSVDGDDVNVSALHLPPDVSLDLADLPESAAQLGLDVAELVDVVRLVVVLLAEQAGPETELAAALLGLHRHLPGVGQDIPLLIDPADPGLVLRDPLGAVRAWLRRLVGHVDAEGHAAFTALLRTVGTLGSDLLAEITGDLADRGDEQVAEARLALAGLLDGAGTFEDPWRAPWPGADTSPRTGSTVGPDLEVWLEPEGPPLGWLGGVSARAAKVAGPEDLALLLREVGQYDAELRSLLRGVSLAELVERLVFLDTYLGSGDGVVPRDSQAPDIFGWAHATEVDAAHHLLPTHPDVVAEVLAWVEQLRQGGPRTVLLLGPDFADRTSWDPLLTSPSRQGTTDPGAHFDLRRPGIDPRTISLADVTAVADYYTAHLAAGDIDFGAAQLAHVADRLAVLHPGPIVVVAHSTAGLVARKFAAEHPSRAAGLVTIGTPHLGAPLPFLRDVDLGDAIRVAAVLTPDLPPSPLRDALTHLHRALEGYRPAPGPGALDVADPYPEAAFSQPSPFDLGDVPVVIISGVLSEDLLPALATALGTHAGALAGQTRAAATHLSYGMAMPVPLDNAPGAPSAAARVRYGLGQVALDPMAPTAPRAQHLLRVELDLARDGGWLLGGPGALALDGRLRSLQLAVTATASTSGPPGVAAVLDARLDQAAWRGTTAATTGLADPRATPLVGAGFAQALTGSPGSENPDNAATVFADTLAAVGLVATDAAGTTSLSADAFAALRADPVGWLRSRIPAALARPAGWAGLVAEGNDGGWHHRPPGSPYGLFVRRDGDAWRTGIETTTDLAAPVWVAADIDIELPTFVPTAELAAHLGMAVLRYRTDTGTVLLDVEPFVHDVRLLPTPTPAELSVHLAEALPDTLATGVLGTVLGQFAPNLRMSALSELLHEPGRFLATALSGAGGGLDLTAISGLLGTLNAALGLPSGPGLQLPGDVSLSAGAGTTPESVAVELSTAAPIGGVLDLALAVEIDTGLHPAAAGSLTLDTALAGSWPRVAVTFGATGSGLSLVVTPQGGPAITILPTFSGLGDLRGAAAALLPQVLDRALAEAATPHAPWLNQVLAAAGHLDLHDPAGGFAAHTAGFQAMLRGSWFDDVTPTERLGFAQAAVDLLTLVPALPGTLDTPGAGLVRWSLGLPADQGDLQVSAGWGLDGPTAALGISDLRPGDNPGLLSATVQVGAGGLGLALSSGVDLSGIGVTTTPRFVLDLDPGGALRARLLPLASTTSDGPLVVALTPELTLTAGPETAQTLIESWAVPLAAQVALTAADPVLTHALWTGGPTLSQALTDAGVLASGNLAQPLPSAFTMLAGFAASAADALDVALGDVNVSLASDAGRLGLQVTGHQAIPVGDLELDVLFEAPGRWGGNAADGLQVFLLDTSSSSVALDFGIQLRGVGVGLARSDGTPLVSESIVRLGSVRAYLFVDLETGTGELVAAHGGAGVQLGGFGLPLAAALGGSGGSNPVASNLLSSGGAGSAAGDSQSVNPAADIDAWFWDDGGETSTLRVLVGGQEGLLWIPIHNGFGPIFIDEVGVGVSSTRLTLAIDGGVSIAGLSAQVDGLSVAVPYATVGDPSTWVLDLKGLAIGYSGPAISIAGGLVKFDGPPIEYDGMLLVKVGNIGAIVIGSYAVVGSGSDEYTSLAIFGGVFVPIGIPPIINLTGVALGLGYNRRLVVPEDLNEIPGFMLVRALDRPEALAQNPMQALYAFRDQVPPARGALWFAAGLRGTSFELVNITAVVYVAFNNGAEVGLLGVARMALPADDAAVVSVELALKARFSGAEGLFSVQAQLTDNSWLISRNCRLTGGFAFFTWFRESQFLLTLGGYHPSFVPRPEYPVVPRVGFQWTFLGVVHIKGESYFALTTSAIMTGTRVEATYGPDWLQLWFTAYADILVTRDPFHYEVDIGISVGARFRFRVCFFACVTLSFNVSVGATLRLAGPPFHGQVRADLGPVSVTVPFGDNALPRPPPKHWDEFVAQYVKAGDLNAGSVQAQVEAGLLPVEPAGGPVAPGTQAQPWRLSAEWTLRTESKMAARGVAVQLDDPIGEDQLGTVVFGRVDKLAGVYDFDLAPMYLPHQDLGIVHRIVLSRRPEGGGAYVSMVPDSQPQPADGTLVLRASQFRVTPLIAQVSEATYHYFPELKPPAAANTLPILSGIKLEGLARLHHQSATVPIGTLVDAGNFRPLPFATRDPAFVSHVLDLGAAWAQVRDVADGLASQKIVEGAVGILGIDETFAELRAEGRLRPGGYGPVALDALAHRRSAPPVLSALSEGYTLEDAGIGVAPPPLRVGEVPGVELESPRLRTVVQRPLVPAGAVPAARTAPPQQRSRRMPPVVNVRDELVTSWATSGLTLVRRPVGEPAQPTRTARSARSLHASALGAPTGRGAAARLDQLTQAARKGVELRAGVTHIWELPAGHRWELVLRGDCAVRVTELSSSGTALGDAEYPAQIFARDGEHRVTLREDVDMVAVSALGRQDGGLDSDHDTTPSAGRAAVSGSATCGTRLVLGWETAGQAVQVGPTTLLTRGSVLRLGAPNGVTARAHRVASGIVSIAAALTEQQVAGTELPGTVTVVGVLLDSTTDAVPGPQDVMVHVQGGTAAPTPLQVVAGRRTLYLYDVRPHSAGDPLLVSAGVTGKTTLAGVLGSTGSAAEWAAAFAGSTLTELVPPEQLTPDGSLVVRLETRRDRDG